MLHPAVKLLESKIEGKGIFTSEFIPKGTVVWKLDSNDKLLSFRQWNELPEEKKKYAYQCGDKYVIVSDISIYLNHSCDPNLWWKDDATLVARREILPGQELTYDYAMSDIDPRTMPDMPCGCGAKNCRKVITAKDCLDPGLQKRHKGHLPSWVIEFIKKNSKGKNRIGFRLCDEYYK